MISIILVPESESRDDEIEKQNGSNIRVSL
jgi:hypothetical protein